MLLTADEAFIASLPPHLAAEAALLRERAYHAASARSAPLMTSGFASMGARRNGPPAPSTSRAATDESLGTAEIEARQVLPCGSEKSIVRLVELSTGVNKTLLHSVLLHLCAHACTRSPTIRLLLAQALAPAPDGSRGSSAFPSPATGLSRRALEALCHLTALQPKVIPLLLDRALLTEGDNSTNQPAYSGKGKNRADVRMDKGTARNIDQGSGSGLSFEKFDSNALDKILLRLAAPDVVKNAATLDLFAQVCS